MRAHRSLYLLAGVAAAAALSGCAPAAAPHAAAKAAPTKTAGSNKAADHALAVWNQALQRWTSGVAVPSPEAPTRNAPRLVYLDYTAMAHHHPLWRLADALAAGETLTAPGAYRAPQAPVLPLANSRPSLQAASLPATAGHLGATSYSGRGAPRQVRTAAAVAPLHEAAGARQESTMAAFLASAAAEQRRQRNADAQALAARLTEDIDAARRPDLPPLEPPLPADAIQLEMTNLRLQLLTNSHLTAAERAAATQRLAALDAQWGRALRLQQDARATELARLMSEAPRRIRTAGEARNAAAIAADSARDEALRAAVGSAHNARVAVDFGASDARLGIVMPAFTRQPAPVTVPFAAGSQLGPNKAQLNVGPPHAAVPYNLNETLPKQRASVPAGEASGGGKVTLATAERITKLHAQALGEARHWGRIVARRKGWQLATTRGAGIVDGTGTALHLLGWRETGSSHTSAAP